LGPSKNEDIEALRAAAVLIVLVGHVDFLIPYEFWLFNRVRTLFSVTTGVDLFFVISGYVIALSLMLSPAHHSPNRRRMMAAFWIKRIFRLLPTATLWLLASLIFLKLTSHSSQVMLPIYAAMANLMNLYLAYCVANPTDPTFCGIPYFHGHYWSLSLEEQFYLVFPGLFFFLNRQFFIVALLLLIVAQMLWSRPVFSYGWFFRTDGLCWGVLLAFLSQKSFYVRLRPRVLDRSWFRHAVTRPLVLLLPFLPVISTSFIPEMQAHILSLVAVFSAIIVWLASYNRNAFAGKGIFRAVTLYLGSRSYALYVSHMIVFRIVGYGFELSGIIATTADERIIINSVTFSLGIALTVLSSEATYRFIESRFRERGRVIAGNVLRNGFSFARKPPYADFDTGA